MSLLNVNIMEKVTVLIVDDEELNLFFLQEALSEYHFEILEATNGKKAIEICKNNRQIKLILMDLKMPVMDGFEATKIIKSKYPEIIIVAQTAYALAYDEEKAKNAGCDDYLTKPLSISLLNKVLAKYDMI